VLGAPAGMVTPAILFVVLAVIAWGRRQQLSALLSSRTR